MNKANKTQNSNIDTQTELDESQPGPFCFYVRLLNSTIVATSSVPGTVVVGVFLLLLLATYKMNREVTHYFV